MSLIKTVLFVFALITIGCGENSNHITGDQAKDVLRKNGIVSNGTTIVSASWSSNTKSWLVITDHGVREDGTPLLGHWFISADGSDWSGSTCIN